MIGGGIETVVEHHAGRVAIVAAVVVKAEQVTGGDVVPPAIAVNQAEANIDIAILPRRIGIQLHLQLGIEAVAILVCAQLKTKFIQCDLIIAGLLLGVVFEKQ